MRPAAQVDGGAPSYRAWIEQLRNSRSRAVTQECFAAAGPLAEGSRSAPAGRRADGQAAQPAPSSTKLAARPQDVRRGAIFLRSGRKAKPCVLDGREGSTTRCVQSHSCTGRPFLPDQSRRARAGAFKDRSRPGSSTERGKRRASHRGTRELPVKSTRPARADRTSSGPAGKCARREAAPRRK